MEKVPGGGITDHHQGLGMLSLNHYIKLPSGAQEVKVCDTYINTGCYQLYQAISLVHLLCIKVRKCFSEVFHQSYCAENAILALKTKRFPALVHAFSRATTPL